MPAQVNQTLRVGRPVSLASDSTQAKGEFAAGMMRLRSCLSFSHAASPSGSSSNRATSASSASGPVPAINCKCGVVLVICLVYAVCSDIQLGVMGCWRWCRPRESSALIAAQVILGRIEREKGTSPLQESRLCSDC